MTTTPALGADQARIAIESIARVVEQDRADDGHLFLMLDDDIETIRSFLAAVPASEPVAVGKDEEILSLHRQLAAEKLRADQGWERYEAANRSRQITENQLAAAPAPVSGMPDLAKLEKWSYSQKLGVMVPNSPQPRRKFYAVEDVERLLNHAKEPK